MDNSTNEAHRLQPGDDKQPLTTKTETGCDPVKRLVRTDFAATVDFMLMSFTVAIIFIGFLSVVAYTGYKLNELDMKHQEMGCRKNH